MLDIVKLFRDDRMERDSLRNVEMSMCKHLGVRPLVIPRKEELCGTVLSMYRKDDWDIMISEDEFHISNMFLHYKPTFDSFPIIQMIYAPRSGAPFWLSQEPYATAIDVVEAGQILCSTEAWCISHYEQSVVMRRFEKVFNAEVVDYLLQKIKVVYLGIELDKLIKPRPVSKDALRIFFPHRPRTQEKGIDFLHEYLRLLSSKTSIPITLVAHVGGSKIWKSLEQHATVEKMGWLKRKEYLDLASGCDIVFAWPRHENFGIAVIESVAMGCWPVLCDDLAYPEIYPKEFLFKTINEAVQKTLDAVGKVFDNSFVVPYFWRNRKNEWLNEIMRVYEEFYQDQKISKAGQRMAGIVRRGAHTKKSLMGEMGWGQTLGWGRYRNMLRQQNISISAGPNPTYGSGGEVEKIRIPEKPSQTIRLF